MFRTHGTQQMGFREIFGCALLLSGFDNRKQMSQVSGLC
jgi:hypothetical protein